MGKRNPNYILKGVGLLFSLYEISDLSRSMKGQNFNGNVIKVAAVVVEKKEGGIDVGS